MGGGGIFLERNGKKEVKILGEQLFGGYLVLQKKGGVEKIP